MVDGLSRIIAHDKRIVGKRGSTVGTSLVQTAYFGSQTVIMSYDEHERFLLHKNKNGASTASTVKSVGGEGIVDKGVCQFGLPNGVKS